MIKVGTDFSGIGSPEQAIKNLGIKHSVEFACEIDKYARQSYLANHDCKKMYEDITTRNHSEVPQLDFYVAGFPCQAFSMAGLRKGFDDVKGTLFFNVAEFIKENKPKSFILENVKGLLSHDNGKTFQTIISILSDNGGTVNGQTSIPFYDDGLGYHIYYKVLNTKQHGIPQNRERIFIVGFKDYREFRFPKPEPLKLKLKDLLEGDVGEKYYLSDKAIASIISNENNLQKSYVNPKIASTIQCPGNSCGTYKGMNAVTNLQGNDYCNTIRGGGRGSLTSKHNWDIVRINENTKKGFTVAEKGDGFYINRPHQKRGVVQKQATPCIKSSADIGVLPLNGRIRKLTPLECFRLQGFPDDFKKVVSDTQLYKQAGNSITVDVIQKVINNIYNQNYGKRI